jgi:phosphoribosylamine--glycine ligase
MKLQDVSAAYNNLEYFITDPTISNWYLAQLGSNISHEHNKSQNHIRFGQYMPPSCSFSSLTNFASISKRSFPFVVKFNANTSIGIQTIIVNSASNFKNVYFASKILGCSQGIVQEFIQGNEYTVTVLVGKQNWVTLGTACDYKKQFENNQGLNTFGLGSISPAPVVHDQTVEIINNVVEILRKEFDYQGPLSCQFIIDSNNRLWLLEHNARVCDPEFQSMAELVDVSAALEQCCKGDYIEQPTIQNKRAVTIGLIHQDWPVAQPEMIDIGLTSSHFKIWKNHGAWSKNLYWGSITNSGDQSHKDLANEIYTWLNKQPIAPYRYRKDIAQ